MQAACQRISASPVAMAPAIRAVIVLTAFPTDTAMMARQNQKSRRTARFGNLSPACMGPRWHLPKLITTRVMIKLFASVARASRKYMPRTSCSTSYWALSLRRRPDESSSSIAGNKALFANMPILDVALRHKPCMQHETNIQVYSLLLYESTCAGHHVPQDSGPCPCVDVPTSHRPPSQATKLSLQTCQF